MPLSILLLGKDAMLLQTRKWLLERGGYGVRTAGDLAELERMAGDGPVDLLILCHSLSAEEAGEAIAAVSARRPQVRVLLLVISGSKRADTLHAATLNSTDGPEGLLSSVASLMGAKGNRSAERPADALRSEPH